MPVPCANFGNSALGGFALRRCRALHFWHHRPSSDRDQDVFRGDFAPRSQPHRVRPRHHRALVEMLDLVAVERRGVGPLQPVDVAGHEIAQFRPVERSFAQRPAVLRGIVQFVGEVRCIDQHLLGHATADHAGSANAEFLRHRHPGAVRCGDPAGAHAARTGADHEKVVVKVCHEMLLSAPDMAARARNCQTVLPVRVIGGSVRGDLPPYSRHCERNDQQWGNTQPIPASASSASVLGSKLAPPPSMDRAMSLPSSTPNWSKGLISISTALAKVRCS